MPIMNTWEQSAIEYNFDDGVEYPATQHKQSIALAGPRDYVHDPIIYPGLYAPSGYDMMSILIRVMTRPNPVIDLGAIDSSCALVLCDIQNTDCTVVYVNEPFTELTGYREKEVLGRNCRFMQAPGGRVRHASARKHVDKDTVQTMCRAVEQHEECAVEVVNFKKNGQSFVNLLAMIPISWDTAEPRFFVGFLAEKTW